MFFFINTINFFVFVTCLILQQNKGGKMSKSDVYCPNKGETITAKECAAGKRGSTKIMCETHSCKHLVNEKPETVSCRGEDITLKSCRKKQRATPNSCIGCPNKSASEDIEVSEETGPVEGVSKDVSPRPAENEVEKPKITKKPGWDDIYPGTQRRLKHKFDVTNLKGLSELTKLNLYDNGFEERQVNFLDTVLHKNHMQFTRLEERQRIDESPKAQVVEKADIQELTKAVNRLAAAIEEQNKQ